MKIRVGTKLQDMQGNYFEVVDVNYSIIFGKSLTTVVLKNEEGDMLNLIDDEIIDLFNKDLFKIIK